MDQTVFLPQEPAGKTGSQTNSDQFSAEKQNSLALKLVSQKTFWTLSVAQFDYWRGKKNYQNLCDLGMTFWPEISCSHAFNMIKIRMK